MKSISWLALASGLTPIGQPAFAFADEQAPVVPAPAAMPVPQGETTDIKDIVVTARRVNESLQRVPVAVTAITSEALRLERIVAPGDLQRVSPSLGVTTASRGLSTPVYMIRGQRAFNPLMLYEPSVTVYFADIGQSLPTGTNLTFYDLSSVQVLKGPQGTLFGRNTTGGAIVITPNAPTDRFEGYGQVNLGRFDYRDFEAMMNVPVAEGLALRVAGKITRRDGYIRDVLQNRSVNDQHADSVRASVRWAPSSAFTSMFVATYFKDDVAAGNKLSLIVPQRIPALGPLAPIFLGQLRAGLAQVNALGRREVANTVSQGAKDKVYSIQNTSTLDISDSLTIKNIVGFRRIETEFSNDLDGSPVDNLVSFGSVRSKQISNELQMIGSSGDLDFITGLYLQQLKGTDISISRVYNNFATIAPANFPAGSIANYRARNRSYAGFVHLGYKLDGVVEGLSLSGGARITRDERHVEFGNRSGIARDFNAKTYRCTLTGIMVDAYQFDGCATPASTHFTEPTYDVSLNYQITPRALLYLAHRHGYRSGGFNPNPSSLVAAFARIVKPEILDDVELGSKTDFNFGGIGGRLNLAAYYSRARDLQRTIIVAIPGGTTGQTAATVLNAARGTVKGVEGELTLRPTSRLTVAVNGSYTDAGYSNFVDNYLVAGALTPVDVSRSKFAFVPRTQISANISYTLPLPETAGDITLRASYFHQSSVQTSEINATNCGPNGLYPNCFNGLGRLPAYGLGNVRLAWNDVARRGFDLALYVDNVTDKSYRNDALNAIQLFGYQSTTIAPPRTWGVELHVPFGG